MKKDSFWYKFLKALGMVNEDSCEESCCCNSGAEACSCNAGAKVVIVAPVSGTVVALKDVEDEAFNSEALGKGCAITPTVGEVYAPCDGVISVVPDTNHAVGITADNGAEVLVHVGMNTVELKGKGFEMLVKEDQKIKQGDLLMKFDMDVIKGAGLPTVTPVVVNNADEYASFDVVVAPGSEVKVGDKLIEAK